MRWWRTWPDEDVLHRQHGRHRQQQLLTPESSSLQQGPGEARLQGELNHELAERRHTSSPATRTMTQHELVKPQAVTNNNNRLIEEVINSNSRAVFLPVTTRLHVVFFITIQLYMHVLIRTPKYILKKLGVGKNILLYLLDLLLRYE